MFRGPFSRGHANVALVTAELQLYKRRSAVGMLLSDGLTQLYCVGLDQRSYCPPGPVSTGMSNRLQAGTPPRFVTNHSSQSGQSSEFRAQRDGK